MGRLRGGSPVGSTVEGEVKNATEFGLFIGLENDIDGMVHLSDLDWAVPGEEAIAKYNKGDMVKAKVLDVDVEKERISLGIKQLAGDPMQGDTYRKGQTVTVTVTEITSGGIEVKFGEDEAPMTAFIRKSDLSATVRTNAPSASPSATAWTPRSPTSTRRAPRLPVGQGAGNGRGKGSHREVRRFGQRRFARRHPGRGSAREGPEGLGSHFGPS